MNKPDWIPALIATAMALIPAYSHAAQYLDPVAVIDVRDPLAQKSTNSDPNMPKELTVPEGHLLQILCIDVIRMVDFRQFWRAAQDQHYQTQVQVDGAAIQVHAHKIPKGTILGTSNGRFWGSEIVVDHPVVYWTATGVGNHELSCFTNWQKTLSDNNFSNNTATAIVRVTPAKPVAKPVAKDPAKPSSVPVITEFTPVERAPTPRAGSPVTVQPELKPAAPPSARPAPAPRGVLRPASSPDPDATAQALQAAGCTPEPRRPGHFLCSTQAGYDRCERLRAANQVQSCKLR